MGWERLELSTSGSLRSYETYALANCATTPTCWCYHPLLQEFKKGLCNMLFTYVQYLSVPRIISFYLFSPLFTFDVQRANFDMSYDEKMMHGYYCSIETGSYLVHMTPLAEHKWISTLYFKLLRFQIYTHHYQYNIQYECSWGKSANFVVLFNLTA